MTIEFYLLIFFLNFLIELSVAFLLGYRHKKFLFAIFGVNLFTHPILTYILLFLLNFNIFSGFFEITILEIAVVLTETKLLEYTFETKNFLKLAIAMNFASYIIGVFLFW